MTAATITRDDIFKHNMHNDHEYVAQVAEWKAYLQNWEVNTTLAFTHSPMISAAIMRQFTHADKFVDVWTTEENVAVAFDDLGSAPVWTEFEGEFLFENMVVATEALIERERDTFQAILHADRLGEIPQELLQRWDEMHDTLTKTAYDALINAQHIEREGIENLVADFEK